MKKHLILIFILLVVTCSKATAQTKGVTFSYWTHGAIPLEKDGAYRISFNASAGYNFNEHFSLQVLVTPDIAMFSNNDIRTYENNTLIGLGAGYMFSPGRNSVNEIVVAAANTISAKGYKYNYFDAGYRLHWGSGKIKLSYGAGVKYYNSQSPAFANSTALYVTVGVRFN